MNPLIPKCWDLCQQVNYNPPETGTFGNQESGDFGLIEFDDSEKIAYIAFRGSDDREDWLSNFRIKINDLGYHSGFYDSSKRVNALYDIPEGYKVVLTGHSRGGALALLTASQLMLSCEVVTFATPKVCTKESRLYKLITDGLIKHTYVVNGLDIVPRAPFEFPWSKDYVRVGAEIRIGKKLNTYQKLRMMWAYLRKEDVDFEWTDDHHPKEYDKSLKDAGLI